MDRTSELFDKFKQASWDFFLILIFFSKNPQTENSRK